MSQDLSQIRQQISHIDRQLLKLLSERHKLAFDVAISKEKTQKPLRDLEREKQLLLDLISFAQMENYQLDPQYITHIFQRIIEDSVLTQQNYLQSKLNQANATMAVAFLGIRGSYSHLASRQFAKSYGEAFIEVSCKSFAEVFEKVQSDEADYGVLPLENTTSGSINEVYDLLQNTDLTLVGELAYPIKHCVLGTHKINLSEIDTIYTHSQPAQQCSIFLQGLDKIHIKYCESSSHAMQIVARLNRPNIVALGNEDGGSLYGLTALQTNIANQINNMTRFIVLAKQPVVISPQIQSKTLLLMTTAQRVGALVDALLVFKQYGIQMLKLESRPIYGKPWEEMFYIELAANIHTENTQKALDELQKVTGYLKVLGCYPSEMIEPAEIFLS